MKPFTESMRYEYPLTKDSIVIDGGGYEGNFSLTLAEKYGCEIFCYEPIKRFAENIHRRVTSSGLPIVVVNAGLGGYEREEVFSIKGDSTGITAESEEKEHVTIVSLPNLVARLSECSLLKLNIEGLELECMEALLDTDLIRKIRFVQVQPHAVFPDADFRWNRIKQRMELSHELTFDAPWCWTGWELR